ncbi:hypothetical protein HanIR_Chr13g0667881 [Helianthus annuus]|nr:hypothetical protein HanIR_Chr13g0667881 [Helianthus annuus]
MLTNTCKYNTEIRKHLSDSAQLSSTLIIINNLYGIHVILRVVTEIDLFFLKDLISKGIIRLLELVPNNSWQI